MGVAGKKIPEVTVEHSRKRGCIADALHGTGHAVGWRSKGTETLNQTMQELQAPRVMKSEAHFNLFILLTISFSCDT